jgi:hypothetical protein
MAHSGSNDLKSSMTATAEFEAFSANGSADSIWRVCEVLALYYMPDNPRFR